jgi:hypothetical protein
MITFDVRIEFYQDHRLAPPSTSATSESYVGAVARRGLTCSALPRPGDYLHNLGPLVSHTLPGRGEVHHLEHCPVPSWHGDDRPGVTVVIHAVWPSDRSDQGGKELLEEYEAKGWTIHFHGRDQENHGTS